MNRISGYKYCPYDGEPLKVRKVDSKRLRVCPECGFTDYQNPKACVAILITKNGKVLLGRRKYKPVKGKWDIPGGFVDRGESVEEAVDRETLEETNLQVESKKYLGSIPDVYGGRKKRPTVNLCFLVKVKDGGQKAGSDVDLLEWFSLERLPKEMAFAHQKRALELLKESERLDW
jgi:ADP-ribose pyrophosphatase YjhB (NUDIX family)